MGKLTLQLWSSFGKSRLYVNDSDGTRVGWHHLRTGVSTIEDGELVVLVLWIAHRREAYRL